jgi:hypothetical protein
LRTKKSPEKVRFSGENEQIEMVLYGVLNIILLAWDAVNSALYEFQFRTNRSEKQHYPIDDLK